MNLKITRFFQGLTLTTFTMGVYYNLNSIKNKENMGNFNEEFKEISSTLKAQTTNQEIGFRTINSKFELLKQQPNINQAQTEAIEKVAKGLESDVNVYKNLCNRFMEQSSIDKLNPEDIVKLLKEVQAEGDSLAKASSKATNELSNILDQIKKGGGVEILQNIYQKFLIFYLL